MEEAKRLVSGKGRRQCGIIPDEGSLRGMTARLRHLFATGYDSRTISPRQNEANTTLNKFGLHELTVPRRCAQSIFWNSNSIFATHIAVGRGSRAGARFLPSAKQILDLAVVGPALRQPG
jgi:hypothetical protein